MLYRIWPLLKEVYHYEKHSTLDSDYLRQVLTLAVVVLFALNFSCNGLDKPVVFVLTGLTSLVLLMVEWLLPRAKNEKHLVLRGDNEKLAQNYKEIERQLRQLRQITKRLNKANRPYFDSLLGKVLYLFKDSSYSYEQELRVIYQTKDNILHTDGDKPWLFVQTPFPLQLDEVILGPKFPDVSTRVPYLQEQLDLMCEKTGTEKPRITLSEIDYR